MILDRIGTALVMSLILLATKVTVCTLSMYGIGQLPSLTYCLLFSLAVFAVEGFYIMNHKVESGLNSNKSIFIKLQALVFNTFLIILSQTWHPTIDKAPIKVQSSLFKLFSNVFFAVIIGSTFAFFSSYSLKSAREMRSSSFDNFDILMVVLCPILSFLMAESFSISGLLAIMVCGFIQSMYGSRNLDEERSYLLVSIFRALGYSSRAICDIMIGLSLGLNLHTIKQVGPLWLLFSVFLVQFISWFGSWLVNKRALSMKLISEEEVKLLMIHENTRGILAYTLALQSFN